MALRKPSDFFGRKKVEENKLPVVKSDNTLREELSKVESLSEQLQQLQQDINQKVVKNDLESLVLSQINVMQENFHNLQNELTETSETNLYNFKQVLSNITQVVNNLVENEIPKYKKQITNNEVRFGDQLKEFKNEVEDKVQDFYQVLNEFNDVVQVIDTVSNIEKYLQEHHQDLITLREEVFTEIEQIPVGNIQENIERLEKKIDFIRETYSKIDSESVAKEIIQEGLLNEPPETKNEDPLTPLDQNFVTIDQLQEHYRLFINRIQQQLSTLGGSGETKLKYLDDIVGIATNASAYDGMFLSYDHTLGKFKFKTVVGGGGGSGDYANVSGIATYAQTSGISTYAVTAGVSTYSGTSGIATYALTAGIATYASVAGVATALQNARTISLTGDVVGSVSFNGTSNVSIAATIQADSVTLGSDTTGDYIQTVSGTANQITVTGGTGEGSTPVLSIPNQFTVPQDITVTRDLQVNRNLNVNGSITIGGTSATLYTSELKVSDPDLVLGFRTDTFGNDISTDNTANHGGIAIASTEGNPLVQLFIAGIETTPATYKKFMWFKAGTFTGLGTDAWISNYAIGIGSTQFPSGTRLAVGQVQFTERDIAVTRNVNASGIITATSFSGNATSATYAQTAGIATVAQGLTGTPNITVGIVTATSYNGSGSNLTGIVTYITAGSGISINQNTGNVTITATGGGGGGSQTLDQTLALGNSSTLGMSVGVTTVTNLNVTGIATIGTGIVTTLRGTNINYTGVSTFTSTFVTNLNVSGVATIGTGIVTTLRGTTLNYTGVSTFSSGPVLISSTGTATTTGTTLQPLQVTGGAYVSGSVGVGTTNPRQTLDVIGTVGIQGISTTNRFYIQHNTAQNSLDFVFV